MRTPLIRSMLFTGLLASLSLPTLAQDGPPPPLPQQSLYVPMRDGVRLAIDVALPADASPETKLPTILLQTRYWRRIEVPLAPGAGDEDRELKAYLTARGYAVVIADVRGSGASFGTRPFEFGADEVRDGYDLVDWIVAQSWSSGLVGSMGTSYLGNTSEFLATVGHPAVRAIVPRFSEWDLYRDIAWPGGIFNSGFVLPWGADNALSDRNLICDDDSESCQELRFYVSGVQPVDADPDHSLLAQAIAEHAGNGLVEDYVPSLQFRDRTDASGRFSLDDRSLYWHQVALGRSNVAVSGWGSWFDGRTADAILLRYESLPQLLQSSIIGPWNHGGDLQADPFRPGQTAPDLSVEDQMELIALFFDQHLKGLHTYDGQRKIFYYTLGKGWESSPQFPPAGTQTQRWHLGSARSLALQSSSTTTETVYPVDYAASSGDANRWTTQLGGTPVDYGDRADADQLLATFDSEPLAQTMQLTGHPVLDLALRIDRDDAAVHAYLEVIAPDGRVIHLSDGQLRALHRAERTSDPSCLKALPCHSFLAADAAPVTPGEPLRLRFALSPVSAVLPQGYRLRVAIAGHDASVFERVPASGETTFRIGHGDGQDSAIELPFVTR